MRFGFFDQLPCADGFSEHQRYKDILAQIDLGDALGFDTVWLGEIHFIRPFSILADPLMALAAVANCSRTWLSFASGQGVRARTLRGTVSTLFVLTPALFTR